MTESPAPYLSEAEFKRRMAQAKLASGDYAAGYQRGLRRLYHGEAFGTAQEHALWMSLGTGNDTRVSLGNGYRDGFLGNPFRPHNATRHTIYLVPEAKQIVDTYEGNLSERVNAAILDGHPRDQEES